MRNAVNVLCEPSPIIGRWRQNAAVPIPQTNLFNNLTHYWLSGGGEDAGIPTTWKELTTGNHASGTPAPALAVGKWYNWELGAGVTGTVPEFNGTQLLTPLSEVTLRFTQASATFAIWVYPIGSTGTIFSKKQASSILHEYRLYISAGRLNWLHYDYSGRIRTVLGPLIPLNQWSHIACWYDDTAGTVGLQVNAGAAQVSGTITPSAADPGGPFRIAANASAADNFSGRLQQLARWSKVLNPAEVNSLFTTPLFTLLNLP